MRPVLATVFLAGFIPWSSLAAPRAEPLGVRALLEGQEEWRWITLHAGHGLPPGRVLSMESDGSGTIWIGTERAIAWFNGYQFSPPLEVADPRVIRDVRRIFRMPDGDIVALAGDRLWKGRQGRLHPLSAPAAVVQAAPLGPDGIYVSTSSGTFLLRSTGRVAAPMPPRGSRIFPGRNAQPWLGVTRLGFVRWEGAGWSAPPIVAGADVFDVMVENETGWVASVRGPMTVSGLWEYDPKRHAAVRRRNTDMARLAILDAAGDGLAAFESGDVRVRRDGEWLSIRNTFNGTMLRRASSLMFTPNGDLWCGGNGVISVFRTDYPNLRSMEYPPGDGRNNIHEILRRKNGELWMATSAGLVVRTTQGESYSLDAVNGRPLGILTGLNEDSQGGVWVSSGSSFGGAYRLYNGTWNHVGRAGGLTDWPVHRIRRDRDGNLWFLSNAAHFQGKPEQAGAFLWRDQQFRKLDRAAGMPDSAVTTMAQAPDGSLWFGGYGGLVRYANGEWEQPLAAAGITGMRVFDISIAPDGAVWFCHQRLGRGVGRLVRASGGRWEATYFNESDGVPSDEVWAVYAEA
ncbi:MAG TPA: two-component regulator propeller domain-containing protein, partial [Bryobacteraceae bacterium]|nr:two-component regulator propeller domain-containing protein [Bryobacteraceae bacterium]